MNERERELLAGLSSPDTRRLQLRSLRTVTSDLIGQYKSAFRGSGLVFSDIREYQPGDDVKHIHWRATARTGTVYVKSYDEDRQLSVVLAVDVSSSVLSGMGEATFRRGLEFCALVASLTLRGGDLLGLLTFADGPKVFLKPKTGRTHYRRVIGSIVSSPLSGGATDVAASLKHLTSVLRRPSVVFVISDFFSPPFANELRQLAYRHDVVLVHMQPTTQTRIPDVGLVAFKDSESGSERLFDTSKRRGREALRAQFEGLGEKIREDAYANGAEYIRVANNAFEPLARLMLERTYKLR